MNLNSCSEQVSIGVKFQIDRGKAVIIRVKYVCQRLCFQVFPKLLHMLSGEVEHRHAQVIHCFYCRVKGIVYFLST